jgi:DNA ligase D-like protein (predicted 3'-phosphoesterase)
MDGVLKSWAVPKGPPEEDGVRRLAIEVDDHPLDYIDFEGAIEEGRGAGAVEVWDRGDYELDERGGKVIVFRLHGRRLHGRYKLVFTGYGRGNGWLLVKGGGKRAGAKPPVGKRK